MSTELRPIAVYTGTADQEGRPVMINGELVAVIVHLVDRIHDRDVGRWHVEATFNLLDRPDRTFATAMDAEMWVQTRFARQTARRVEGLESARRH